MLLCEERFLLRRRLEAGDLVLFDNQRVLHGRGAFDSREHLQGCYLDEDDC